jgi:serine/threonine-protein kinase
LEGTSLWAIYRRLPREIRALEFAPALTVACAICRGLSYALQQEGGPFLHGTNPHNVIVTKTGQVKLIDFRIAEARKYPVQKSGSCLKGWAWYLSPEHLRKMPLDGRSNVFSLGICIYEMTLGCRPFAAENDFAVASKILEEEPTLPRQIQPTYPAELETIVLQALHKNPDRRFPSVMALETALTDFMRRCHIRPAVAALSRLASPTDESMICPW